SHACRCAAGAAPAQPPLALHDALPTFNALLVDPSAQTGSSTIFRNNAPVTPIRDVLLGVAASRDEPIAGGRHKVIGSVPLAVWPDRKSTRLNSSQVKISHAAVRLTKKN